MKAGIRAIFFKWLFFVGKGVEGMINLGMGGEKGAGEYVLGAEGVVGGHNSCRVGHKGEEVRGRGSFY